MPTDLIESLLAEMSRTRPSDMMPLKAEPGEARSLDIPPFPSYSVEPEGLPVASNPTKYPVPRSFTGGPVPAPGTPQDRFAAVLGHPRYGSVPTALMAMGFSADQPYQTHPNQQPSALNMQFSAPGVDIPGALPASQSMANYVPPALRQTPSGSNGRSDSSGSGRGPTLPERGAPVTTWLSFECQRRHFNPEFKTKETFTKDGRPKYQSTVIVKDIVINSNSLFDDPAAAKAHIADKALRYIRREWPRNGLPASYGGTPEPTAVRTNMEDLGRRQEELRQLLKQRHQAKSIESKKSGSSPPVSASVDMSDPAQAQAFVEGFNVGRLAGLREASGSGASPPSIPQSRRRSRSPGRGRSSSQSKAEKAEEPYRQRSPIRNATRTSRTAPSPPRYFDGSRHDARLPSTDRYRPRSSPSRK
ncbi:hypothetical protein KVR01_006532 [Diaporthe batatas]|uniref:uncharacterized protein n=1 Tax=Diaporthe batatas TaxID=748121 RepID=UPI001D03ED5A|nr:uncharacterized protein KVR01_006532 [Diaporthe batatas]KAG8163235.1 hypothetical protein KVR01_006532 [Diaporthe batatas]